VPRSPDDTDADVKITPQHTPEFEAAQAWRATPPKPGPERPLVLPKPTVFTLENGLTVYLVERHELPIVPCNCLRWRGRGQPAGPPGPGWDYRGAADGRHGEAVGGADCERGFGAAGYRSEFIERLRQRGIAGDVAAVQAHAGAGWSCWRTRPSIRRFLRGSGADARRR
jgi:hypothetical protein